MSQCWLYAVLPNQFQNIVDQNGSEHTDELQKSESSPLETAPSPCVYLHISTHGNSKCMMEEIQ